MEELSGQVFGGCEILDLLGRGGMGDVYRGLQKSLERHVAIKLLPSRLIEDPSYVERFLLEAKSIARLSHTNVVQVYDAGQEGDYYYIVMELVEGGTLKDLIAERHVPQEIEVIDFMEQAAMGLGAAHQHGIIHRDVKPGNIMLTSDRVVKVTDFGLAKAVQKEGKEITKTGEVVGTPAYMSPEQCEGSVVDHRSDFYSFGATFYHFAAGKTPFSAEGPVQMMFKHIREEPEKLMVVRPDIPVALSNVLDRCLAKDPFDRYQSSEEIILDIHRAADGRPVEPYRPGEGRKNFMSGAEDTTSVYEMPKKTATHGTTVYRKRELNAKEQEQRGDLEAKRGRWAFALMAYKEALKVFPDSDGLKAKLATVQAKVEQEGLEDSLSRARRSVMEHRFNEAYDILGAAIRGATNDEQRERARAALQEAELTERVWSRKRRAHLVFQLIVGAVAAVVIITVVQRYAGEGLFDYFAGTADGQAGETQSEGSSDGADLEALPGGVLIVEEGWDEEPSGTPDTGESGEGDAAENPLVKMLLEAAKARGEGEGGTPAPTVEEAVEKVSLEEVERKRVSLREALSVAVPVFLREQESDEDRVVCVGRDNWGGSWEFRLERVSEDLGLGEALDDFLERAEVEDGGEVERGWRFASGFGRVPEAGFVTGDNGKTTKVVVFPVADEHVLAVLGYSGEHADLLGQAYADILRSARAAR